ncbi:MAG TPA: hypothetical protein VGM34_00605, partial [Chlamydiales bacterium]
LFLPSDPLIRTFLGFQYLFGGQEKKGKELLQKVHRVLPDHLVVEDTIVGDYLSGKTDANGIQAIFQEVDASRTSILEKQKELQAIVQKRPQFRAGVFHLAVTYLQLGREKEALPILEQYMSLDTKNPTVCYYLSAIHAQRMNYNAAWKYLKSAEAIVHERNHSPQALEELRSSLQRACPEPVTLNM